MAMATKYTCDVCGAERQESNHWFMWQGDITFEKWSEDLADTEEWGHLCGIGCATKKLSEVLGR